MVDPAHRRLLSWLQHHNLSIEFDRHLMAEHQILDCLDESARAWQSLQRNPRPSPNDLRSGNELVRQSKDRLVLCLLSTSESHS